MMLTTIKITEELEEAARQAGAADGLVTAEIKQLRLNQTNPVNALPHAHQKADPNVEQLSQGPGTLSGPFLVFGPHQLGLPLTL
jgi:hypothetical protein